MKTKIMIILFLIVFVVLLFAFKHYLDNSVVDKTGMIIVTEDETVSVNDTSSDNS